MSARAEAFAHGADIGVRGRGRTPAEAFANVARAMTAVITDPDGVRDVERVAVHCEASDLESLLVAWLNEIVYHMATRHLLFGRFEVTIDRAGAAGWRLDAVLGGEPVDVVRHEPAVEVKGATYTSLEVVQRAGEWVAACVVDV